jgi:hypothetical protein
MTGRVVCWTDHCLKHLNIQAQFNAHGVVVWGWSASKYGDGTHGCGHAVRSRETAKTLDRIVDHVLYE